MVQLVLLRHGQSKSNAERFLAGREDVPLTAQGEAEARRAGELLRGHHFDFVFTSELERAWRTTEIVLETLGERVVYTRVPALIEKDFGQFSGRPLSALDEYRDQPWYGNLDMPMPGGEGREQIDKRVHNYFNHHVRKMLAAGHSVLIVAHVHVLLSIARLVEGTDELIILKNCVPRVYELDENLNVTSVKNLL